MERRELVVRSGEDPALALRALQAGGWRLESFRTACADRLPPGLTPGLLPPQPPLRRDEVVVVLECVKGRGGVRARAATPGERRLPRVTALPHSL
jgi:hypothetical protein